MPGGDRTGPLGLGPKTGRGMGFCAGYQTSGYMNPGFRRGRFWRRGFGRGFGWRYQNKYDMPAEPVALTKEEEKRILENELKEIEREKEEIKKRLKELNWKEK